MKNNRVEVRRRDNKLQVILFSHITGNARYRRKNKVLEQISLMLEITKIATNKEQEALTPWSKVDVFTSKQ